MPCNNFLSCIPAVTCGILSAYSLWFASVTDSQTVSHGLGIPTGTTLIPLSLILWYFRHRYEPSTSITLSPAHLASQILRIIIIASSVNTHNQATFSWKQQSATLLSLLFFHEDGTFILPHRSRRIKQYQCRNCVGLQGVNKGSTQYIVLRELCFVGSFHHTTRVHHLCWCKPMLFVTL